MNAVMRFKCGHTEIAQFEYALAAKDWQRWARTEECSYCAAGQPVPATKETP